MGWGGDALPRGTSQAIESIYKLPDLRSYTTDTKSSTTWGPLAAPRTNHGLNPMFDKQTSLMDAPYIGSAD